MATYDAGRRPVSPGRPSRQRELRFLAETVSLGTPGGESAGFGATAAVAFSPRRVRMAPDDRVTPARSVECHGAADTNH